MKHILRLFLLFLLLVPFFYLFSPQILAYGATYISSKFFDIELALEVERPTVSALKVISAKLVRIDDKQTLEATFSDTNITYSLRSLLKKQLNSLSIGGGTILLSSKKSDSKDEKPLSGQDISPLTQSLQSLPIESIVIKKLTVMTEDTNGIEHEAMINGRLDKQALEVDLGVEATITPFKGLFEIPPIIASFNLNIRENILKSEALVNISNTPLSLKAFAESVLNKESGEMSIELDTVDVASEQAKSLLKNIRSSVPFNIKSGSLTGSAKLTWEGNVIKTSLLDVKVEKLSGSLINTEIVEASGRLSITDFKNPKMKSPSRIEIKQLDIGVPINNIALDLTLGGNLLAGLSKLTVSRASAEMFGGRILCEKADLNLKKPENQFILTFSQLNLEEVLSLYKTQGIFGTGYINGSLPINIGEEGISIKNGRLNSLPPGGIIRYKRDESGDNLASVNKSFQFLLEALEDFHYESVQAVVNYDERGNLKLETTLKGKNPKMEEKRRIELNANIEENIPALLRTLNLTKELQSGIEKGLIPK